MKTSLKLFKKGKPSLALTTFAKQYNNFVNAYFFRILLLFIMDKYIFSKETRHT